MGGGRRGGPGRGAAGPELQLPWEGWRWAGHRSAREADRTRGLLTEVVLRSPDSGPHRPWRRVQSGLRSSHHHLLPPPITHIFSAFVSLSSLVPLFPVLLSLHLPLCLLWESYWRHNQAEYQTEGDGRSSFLIHPTPVSLDPQLCRGWMS